MIEVEEINETREQLETEALFKHLAGDLVFHGERLKRKTPRLQQKNWF